MPKWPWIVRARFRSAASWNSAPLSSKLCTLWVFREARGKETQLKLTPFYLSDTFYKRGGYLPFVLKLEIQKSPLSLRNLKFTQFKKMGSVQCKNQTQAGSPEVRFFSTSCRLQQLFHHLTSLLGSGKLSDPHQLVKLENRSGMLARPLIRTPISTTFIEHGGSKSGC